MTFLDELLSRNDQIAATNRESKERGSSLRDAIVHVKAIVIGCGDMRVDPAHVLGLKPGEALVLCNIGGRVTPGLLQQLGMLARIGQVEGKAPGGGGPFHLILLQHTDCGITRLAGDAASLARYFQVDEAALPGKALLDPRAAVTQDAAFLRTIGSLPPSWILSGLVYDVASGRIETVVAPAPIRPA